MRSAHGLVGCRTLTTALQQSGIENCGLKEALHRLLQGSLFDGWAYFFLRASMLVQLLGIKIRNDSSIRC